MIEFDAILLEVKSNLSSGTFATWTNVWEDVRGNVTGSYGRMDNELTGFVQTGNTLNFALDNSEKNSVSTLWYYSGKIMPGFLVRLGFTKWGRTRYKWAGYIPLDGITPDPFPVGPRKLNITARDWFSVMSEYKIFNLEYATSKRIDQAVPLVVNTLPTSLQPVYTDYKTGDFTFPDVFDIENGETTAISEFNKLATSEFGRVYMRGNEFDGQTLVAESGTWRYLTQTAQAVKIPDDETTDLFLLANGTDNLLLANGTDQLLLTDTEAITVTLNDSMGAAPPTIKILYADAYKARVYGRKTDSAATTVLWTMENPLLVAAGTTVSDIRGRYRDPSGGSSYINCISGTNPVATTDYKAYANENGTGTDLTTNCHVTATFGAAEVELSIYNSSATDFYVGGREGGAKFQVRGQGRYIYDSTDISYYGADKTQENYETVGQRTLFFDMVYNSDVNAVGLRLAQMRTAFKDLRAFYDTFPLFANRDTKNMRAFMWLEVGDRLIVDYSTLSAFAPYTGLGETSPYEKINGYSFEIRKTQKVYWKPVLQRTY